MSDAASTAGGVLEDYGPWSMRRLSTLIVVAGVALGLAACQPSGDCGRVLTEDTTLQADVRNCPGDGLVIGADGIVVRLDGHTVDGTEAAGSAGIRLAGHDDVLIEGPGRITEFADGVLVADGLRNRVRNLTSTDNGFGIHLVDADASRLIGNDARDNLGVGASPSGIRRAGILLEGSDGNLVEGNELFQDAGGPGAVLVGSSSNRVLDNVARNSDNPNIWLRESHRNVVAGNHSTGSNVVAIELIASDDNLVERNVASDNESEGITVTGGSSRNVVRFNEALLNENVGIVVLDAVGTVIRGNDTSGQRTRTTADGIQVRAAASGTVVRENTSNGNGDDGIDVDSPSTRIVDNTADGNGDLGIEAVAGVSDGGGNRASGNGNPAQCTGVVCT
jgi:parallel beta-helix repeat protein